MSRVPCPLSVEACVEFSHATLHSLYDGRLASMRAHRIILGMVLATGRVTTTPAESKVVAASAHDKARDDARFQALLPREGTGPSCWLVLFLHVEACGFSTLREHFTSIPSVETFAKGSIVFHTRSSLARARAARQAVPVGHSRCTPTPSSWISERDSCTWQKLLRELASGPDTHHQRVVVELPTMAFASSKANHLELLLSATRKLRHAWQARGCPVVLACLVREPREHLIALFSRFVRPDLRSPESLGREFPAWAHSARAHNPASRLLLGEPVLGEPPAATMMTPADVHVRLPRLQNALSSFDLVAPLSAFDEFFFLLAERIGLRERRYSLPRWNGGAAAAANLSSSGRPPGAVPTPDLALAAMHAAKLDWDSLTTTALSADQLVYANVSRAWEGAVAALEAGTRTRMGRFKALMRIARREDARKAAAAALRLDAKAGAGRARAVKTTSKMASRRRMTAPRSSP